MKLKLIIPIIIAIIMSSCTQVVIDSADEVRLNSWVAKLKNGSSVSLNFIDDIATLNIKNPDKNACVSIKGLGVIDDKRILIHNKSESESYIFNYTIKNNHLILKYNHGSISLSRKNKNPSG